MAARRPPFDMAEPRKIDARNAPVALDLRDFTSGERELLVRFAKLLREGRARPEARGEALRLWHSYSALPPAIDDKDEADRIALDAVADARGGA